MSGNRDKIIAFNYFGGKFSWLNHLYDNFPNDFVHLVDLFSGSMVVSLNYKGKIIKTANEINSDITNFFEVLRNNEPDLTRMLLLTPCSIEEFDNCWEKTDDPLENARRFYVRVRQSFFGLGAQRQNKGWHFAKEHYNCQGGETVSRWNNAIKKLHDVAEVIRTNFQITNWDCFDCIDKSDFKKAFFYVDPPYPLESRASKNDYKFEFSDEDHRKLAERLHCIEGYAMISGYECVLMNELYGDWTKVKLPVKMNSIRSSKVQEVIWFNYSLDETRSGQSNLFNNQMQS